MNEIDNEKKRILCKSISEETLIDEDYKSEDDDKNSNINNSDIRVIKIKEKVNCDVGLMKKIENQSIYNTNYSSNTISEIDLDSKNIQNITEDITETKINTIIREIIEIDETSRVDIQDEQINKVEILDRNLEYAILEQADRHIKQVETIQISKKNTIEAGIICENPIRENRIIQFLKSVETADNDPIKTNIPQDLVDIKILISHH